MPERVPAFGVYVHIPFCASKCVYCNFLSGLAPAGPFFEAYASLILKELRLYREIFMAERGAFPKVTSLYFGGGTPSLLPPENIAAITAALEKDLRTDAEITLEINPEDVTAERARKWKRAGINRVSLGYQWPSDTILRRLGRRNRVESTRRAVMLLREAGFDNLSLDFIAGIFGTRVPGLLREIEFLRPDHLSLYGLTIEPGTPLSAMKERGAYLPRSEASFLGQLSALNTAFQAMGYDRYEVSNYCRAGRYSRHNMNYWERGEYLGLGLGASGFLFSPGSPWGERLKNVFEPQTYLEMLEKDLLPALEREILTADDALKEWSMLGLRTAKGAIYSECPLTLKQTPDFKGLEDFLEWDERGFRLKAAGYPVMNAVIREVWKRMGKESK